ncbi:MAG TPA: tRNA (adenosine(37)-N6)-threonylcarbamoyltransferase complex transferase subunit TsaD, partial [Anaerolineae bacterium]|nr:tRNA (adenosine(37)-N6)-threonylcarbamoyltransferase complex transferase subunit TsaD [Anaerolineae bacterium]
MALRILGIETSCDETAAAVVEEGRLILSNVIASQIELHAPYGGVFPELAARAHIETIVPVVETALQEAHLGW